MKILGLSGEYRTTSKCGLLVNIALGIAKEKGAEVIFWDLDTDPLPIVGEEGCWENENVKRFQDLATSCDAFLAASPEYHGTMSGAMKNTFDWLYGKHISGKPVGLMSSSKVWICLEIHFKEAEMNHTHMLGFMFNQDIQRG